MAGVSEEEFRTVRFEPEMIPACARIYLDVYTNEPWNETVESAEAVERFFRRHAAGGEFIGYALLSGGRPAGFAIGFAKPWIKGVEFYLDELCLAREFQHRGFGSRFMAEIRADLKKRGLNGILLNTSRHCPSFRFYRKLGFEPFEKLVVMGVEF
jgi:acetyltransferase, GNAT family